MSTPWIIYTVVVTIVAVYLFASWWEGEADKIIGAFMVLCVLGIGGCITQDVTSGDHEAREKKRQAAEYADSVPRLVREADGCKVYAFKPSAGSHWHYFTRCPNSTVTTDTQHTVRSGKTSRTETTQIVTETK